MTFIKRTVTLAFLLMLEFALMASGQVEPRSEDRDKLREIPRNGEIERNPQEAYFEVGKMENLFQGRIETGTPFAYYYARDV